MVESVHMWLLCDGASQGRKLDEIKIWNTLMDMTDMELTAIYKIYISP